MALSTLAASSSGNFLVSPNLGVMIWTLIAFLIAVYLLSKLAFPRITEALDKRQKTIEESIDSAEQTREEAQQLLAEYRERLKEARAQSDEIVQHARQTAETHERERRRALVSWLPRRPGAVSATSRRPPSGRSESSAKRSPT
jgi:F-type H+-transporting ATPase subunit b